MVKKWKSRPAGMLRRRLSKVEHSGNNTCKHEGWTSSDHLKNGLNDQKKTSTFIISWYTAEQRMTSLNARKGT